MRCNEERVLSLIRRRLITNELNKIVRIFRMLTLCEMFMCELRREFIIKEQLHCNYLKL
jgi:hypothetical protein